MTLDNALSHAVASKETRGTTKEELLIDLHQFLFPKLLLIKNISGKELGCDATSQVFQGLAGTVSDQLI